MKDFISDNFIFVGLFALAVALLGSLFVDSHSRRSCRERVFSACHGTGCAVDAETVCK